MAGIHWGKAHSTVQGRSLRRGRLLLSCTGLLALLLAGCGANANSPTVLAKNQVFVWPYDNSVTSISGNGHGEVLDPAVNTTLMDAPTIAMLYSGLVTFDSSLHVVPDAATWDVDSTGTIYTFHLRHNMHFSDGTPITASDYAYSLDRSLDPTLCTVLDSATYGPNASGACQGSPPPSQSYLGNILGASARLSGTGGTDHSVVGKGDDPQHGVDVIDPYTLRIRLARPVGFFLESLSYSTSYPVEQSLIQKYPNGLWVDHLDEGGCSGPFKIQSYNNGQKLTLVPNPY